MRDLISKQLHCGTCGTFANKLLNHAGFEWPRPVPLCTQPQWQSAGRLERHCLLFHRPLLPSQEQQWRLQSVRIELHLLSSLLPLFLLIDRRMRARMYTHSLTQHTHKNTRYQGKNDDMAHPPIHPIALPTNLTNPKQKQLYELIVRHFLACCSKDAVGAETGLSAFLSLFLSLSLSLSLFSLCPLARSFACNVLFFDGSRSLSRSSSMCWYLCAPSGCRY